MTPLEFILGHQGSSVRLSEAESQYLHDPAIRRQLLRAIHTRPSTDASGLLRYILALETGDSSGGNNPDFYENLYWCAYLVWRMKKLEDVPALWRAKNMNFDAGAGFDVQFLTGAGVDETIHYLQARDDPESGAAAAYLIKCKDAGDFDALQDWAAWREHYFAGITDAT